MKKNLSFIHYCCLTVTAILFVFTSCSKDEFGVESGNNDIGSYKPLMYKLKDVKRSYGGEDKTPPFSNFKYDERNRLIEYQGEYSYLYSYSYSRDSIKVYLGRVMSDQKRIEYSYNLKNGRVESLSYYKKYCCEYDGDGRLIAVSNCPMNGFSVRYDIVWENGNIIKITESSEKSGKVVSEKYIEYYDEPCLTLMPYIGHIADHGVFNPYGCIDNCIDPILVEEGYFGNSMIKNQYKSITSYSTNDQYTVNHEFSYDYSKDGLPVKIYYKWPPSGRETHGFIWM